MNRYYFPSHARWQIEIVRWAGVCEGMQHTAQRMERFVRGAMIDPDQVGRRVVCVVRCRWRVVGG